MAKRYHPDKCTDSTIFATITQAFQMIEKQQPPAPSITVGSRMGAMPISMSRVYTSKEKPRILSFVDQQGKPVRQEVTVRHTPHGQQEVMAVTMPPPPPPHKPSPPSPSPPSPPPQHGPAMYRAGARLDAEAEACSREMAMPMPFRKPGGIPF